MLQWLWKGIGIGILLLLDAHRGAWPGQEGGNFSSCGIPWIPVWDSRALLPALPGTTPGLAQGSRDCHKPTAQGPCGSGIAARAPCPFLPPLCHGGGKATLNPPRSKGNFRRGRTGSWRETGTLERLWSWAGGVLGSWDVLPGAVSVLGMWAHRIPAGSGSRSVLCQQQEGFGVSVLEWWRQG